MRLVIPESFERIFRQNADNRDLLTSTELVLIERLERGELPTLAELLTGRDRLACAVVRAGDLFRYGLRPDAPASTPVPGP